MRKTILSLVFVSLALLLICGIFGCFSQPYRSSAGLGVPAVNDYYPVRLDYGCIIAENDPDPANDRGISSTEFGFHQVVFCKRVGDNVFLIPTISHGSTRGSDPYRHTNDLIRIEAASLRNEDPRGIAIASIDTVTSVQVIPDPNKDIDYKYFNAHKKEPGSYVMLSNSATMAIRRCQDAYDRTLYSTVDWLQCIDGIVESKDSFNFNVFSSHERIFNTYLASKPYFLRGSIRTLEIHRKGNRFYIPCIVHVGDYLRDKVIIEIETTSEGTQELSLSYLFDEAHIRTAKFVDRREFPPEQKIVIPYGKERVVSDLFFSAGYSYRPWSRRTIHIDRIEDE